MPGFADSMTKLHVLHLPTFKSPIPNRFGMRSSFLLLILLPVAVSSQPAQDQNGVTAAFGDFVSAAHNGGIETITDLIACPVDVGEERLVVGVCDTTLAAHRVRVENLTTLATLLFSSEPAALSPHYGVEEESDGVFHFLLFADVGTADYVMAAFMDVGGTYRLTNLDTEGGPENIPAPASIVESFDALIVAAKEDSVESFAMHVVARSNDDSRDWKAAADPALPDELEFVDGALQRVRGFLEASRDDFEIVGYESEQESEGEWHVLHVRFDTHEVEENVSFAFLPVGESLLLGDID